MLVRVPVLGMQGVLEKLILDKKNLALRGLFTLFPAHFLIESFSG